MGCEESHPILLSAILFRRNAGVFLKYFGKITLVFKAGCNGDVDQRVIRVGEQPFAFFNADHIQVFFKRRTTGLFECRGEVGRVQVYMACNFF